MLISGSLVRAQQAEPNTEKPHFVRLFYTHPCPFPSKIATLFVSPKTFITLLRSAKTVVPAITNNVSNSIGRYIHGLIGVTATWERSEMRMESQ